jgi:hypothetical protein
MINGTRKVMDTICSKRNQQRHLPALKRYVIQAIETYPEFERVFRKAYDAVESPLMFKHNFEPIGRGPDGFRVWNEFKFLY